MSSGRKILYYAWTCCINELEKLVTNALVWKILCWQVCFSFLARFVLSPFLILDKLMYGSGLVEFSHC